jgi:hypothetical protein
VLAGAGVLGVRYGGVPMEAARERPEVEADEDDDLPIDELIARS